MGSSSPSRTARCVIAHNTVQNNGSNGIDINGSHNAVIGNVVHANGSRFAGTGVDGWGVLLAAIAGQSDANFNVVISNIVTNTTMLGIIVRPDTARTADYNIIEGNFVEGVGTADSNEDGITIDGSAPGTLEGNLIVGNTVRSCKRHGIALSDVAATVSRTLVEGNNCVNNADTGIRIDATDTWIMGNVALGNTVAQIDDTGSVRASKVANKVSAADNFIAVDNLAIGGGGTPIQRYLSTTATWDPPNLAAGAQTTTTVTVTNAALGDVATASFSLDLQGSATYGLCLGGQWRHSGPPEWDRRARRPRVRDAARRRLAALTREVRRLPARSCRVWSETTS